MVNYGKSEEYDFWQGPMLKNNLMLLWSFPVKYQDELWKVEDLSYRGSVAYLKLKRVGNAVLEVPALACMQDDDCYKVVSKQRPPT